MRGALLMVVMVGGLLLTVGYLEWATRSAALGPVRHSLRD